MNQDVIAIWGAPPSWKLRPIAQKILNRLRDEKLVPKKISASTKVVISISCLDEKEMAKLNKEFRGKAKATDVLSFEQPGKTAIKNVCFLGDIAVCVPIVRAQAVKMKHSVLKEAEVLIVHGLLHLLGFDHEKSPKAAREMAALEARLIKSTSGLVKRAAIKG